MAAALTVFAGSANPTLAASVAAALGIDPVARTIDEFPDGEIQVTLQQDVRGHDVYLIQSTSPPVHRHLVELMLAADACRRGGARHVTAVVPYVGYARQDRRGLAPTSFGARVMADIVGAGSVDRLVTVDLHNSAIEGFFAVPVEHLTAVPILAGALESRLAADHAVVVAPDLGAVKLAQRYGRILGLPVAIVQKQRLSGSAVAADSVAGDVSGRVPVIVDDMLSTGATIAGACRVLAAAGAASGAGVVVTHGLFTGSAEAVLKNLSLGFLMTSDSVAAGPPGLDVTVLSLGPLLAEAIRRMHSGGPLADVYAAVRTSARAAPRSD